MHSGKTSRSSGDPGAEPLLPAGQVQAILEAVPGNYLILEPDAPRFTIVAVSDAYAVATNTLREQIIGKGLFDVFPDNPADPHATGVENLTASLMSVLKHKRPHRMAIQKYDIPCPEGGPFEERFWSPLNCPVLGENGEVAHIVHSVVDVTQNIHLEKREQEAILQLDAERRRLYDLFMQAPAAVLIVSGHDHIVELANPMTLAFWRKTSDEVIGKPMLRAFPEAQGQGFDQIIEGVFRTGEPFLGEAQQVLRDQSDDGNSNSSYFTFVFVPVRGHTDEVEGVMAFAYDVTAQVLARERIEELARQKDEFLSIVSHELKTPVTSVKAYTQVLRNRFTRAGDKDAAAMLAKMDTQLNKLRGLIGDLVDITALETGKLQFQQEPFDFNALVAEVVEEMQRTTERHSIICRTPQPCTIVGDRDRTGQVLTNFLSNAIKYSPDADTVLVTTAATQKAATACVQDFGIGIPRGMQNQVFERFYRADRSTLDTYPGIGLGLYICAEIVRRLQGRIWVESEIGKGSTFCFELPLERAGAVAEQD